MKIKKVQKDLIIVKFPKKTIFREKGHFGDFFEGRKKSNLRKLGKNRNKKR